MIGKVQQIVSTGTGGIFGTTRKVEISAGLRMIELHSSHLRWAS
jgi:hypothetical protein